MPAPTISWRPMQIWLESLGPFCLQMMEEGIQAKGKDGEKQSKDVLEILSDSLD